MIDKLTKYLKGTREHMGNALYLLDIEAPDDILDKLSISECSHCNIWVAKTVMENDESGFNICPTCLDLETLRF